ncbi:Protein of unknown function [Thermomonospora echinospora]|uniref:DUF2637 domain-containing protein n=1 Tax=Thermomonospora echinospora TaxID=1992 RepID=A0A1H5UT29_9ACTN|nr:DUF2637 domain-containing protein [Thermomonospora echinospora]SEF78166.1 Protein of unknown function [Thermomonospora echinospora]
MNRSDNPGPPTAEGGQVILGRFASRTTRTAHGPAIKIVVAVLTPLILALAVLGGVGSFTTVRDMAEPWFGGLAWIVPVGMDVGIFILLAWDLLMEYLALPWPVLRWVAWTFIAGTVTVNVLAAGGDTAGVVMHAAMPVLFVTVVEGVRHLIRQWVGLTTGTRIERIPTARWLLAPLSTGLLWRRMVLWNITAYHQALDLEYQHQLAISRLQQQHGRWAWRWRAPLAARIALRRLPAEPTCRAVLGPSLHEPSGDTPADPEPAQDEQTDERTGGFDEELLAVTRRLIAEANRQGVRPSRANLGRRLRALGFTISNERLIELRAAAGGEAGTHPEDREDRTP